MLGESINNNLGQRSYLIGLRKALIRSNHSQNIGYYISNQNPQSLVYDALNESQFRLLHKKLWSK